MAAHKARWLPYLFNFKRVLCVCTRKLNLRILDVFKMTGIALKIDRSLFTCDKNMTFFNVVHQDIHVLLNTQATHLLQKVDGNVSRYQKNLLKTMCAHIN